MSSPSIQPERFSNILLSELYQTRKLLDLLQQEYNLLLKHDPNQLEQLIERKKAHIRILEQTVAEHNLLLMEMGYPANQEGIEAYLNHQSSSNQLGELWSDLKQTLIDCQKQNEVNRGVITLCRRQTSSTLELIYGLSGREKAYGPTGESYATHQSNSLGKA